MKHKKSKPIVIKTRKEVRKEQRLQKKARMHEHFINRNRGGRYVLNPGNLEEFEKKPSTFKVVNGANKKVTLNELQLNSLSKEKQEQKKLQNEMRKQRTEQLLKANTEEDRNIKRLEKQLHLNKRKSKNTPKYLLEVCDSENLKAAVAAEQQFSAANENFEEDFELMVGKKEKQKQKEKSKSSDESDMDLEDDFSDDDDMCDDGSNVENEEMSDASEDVSDVNEETTEDGTDRSEEITDAIGDEKLNNLEKNTWEDIYGRLRAKDGTVIPSKSDKYVPPAARAKLEAGSSEDKVHSEKLKRLERQLKGLLNRLAESNMHSIATQIEGLYMNNSRNNMNDTVTSLLLNSLVTPVLTPERLLLEHMLLISILHANIGTEVGAHFLQTFVKKFDDLYNDANEAENKMLHNIVSVIAQLYNYKIIQASLIYELLNKLTERFTETDIECILLVLKSIGFGLRKDDPLALKKLILSIQQKANLMDADHHNNPRVKFMLEILLAVKNNNMTKIPNYDTTYSDHLKKLQKSFIHKGNYVTTLNISLEDLLNAEEYGKWWIVGSAWSGKTIEGDHKKQDVSKLRQFPQKLLDLARKQRMNTDTRRNVFCIIMSAEGYLDAFEQLLRLGLKNLQEREIINIILHCCLQEKSFNVYYALLAEKFCKYDRKFQMTIKYSIWDKLKVLKECSTSQLSNLAKLLTHLFLEKGLSVSTLKIVHFTELDNISLRFIRQILIGILLHDDEETSIGVFRNVAQSERLKVFRERLKLFIQHFLVKNLEIDSVTDKQKQLLNDRAKIVINMLVWKLYCVGNRYLSHFSIENVLNEVHLRATAKKFASMHTPSWPKPIPNKKAAVLIPLCVIHGKVSLLYTLRAANLNSHRGQVSFPGGMADDEDESLEHTAVRETVEELGISESSIVVWGRGKFIGSITKINVLPVIGQITENITPALLKVNRNEVEDVFAVPLEELCNEKFHGHTQFRAGASAPVYLGAPYRIWGITAYITYQFLRALLPPQANSHNIVHVPPVG
ncbi:hypothetical protein FQA39_LY04089 [Lamprigera yunnana]|nr:hypothetical protein FQA39_LY04089 [Lamprigera yunnana]